MMPVPPSVIVTTAITTLTGLLVTALYRKLAGYIEHSGEWRTQTDKKLDVVTGALQTTMRADLAHLYEKYMTRGWLTAEEHAAWHDMHARYSGLGPNGLIDSYGERLDQLPHKEVD